MYSMKQAAAAIGISLKRLDNILVGPGRQLIARGRRGCARVILLQDVELVAIALLLQRDLGCGVADGIHLASRLIAAPEGRVPVGALGLLAFDVGRLRSIVRGALDDALAEFPRPTRGRPRQGTRKKRGAPYKAPRFLSLVNGA